MTLSLISDYTPSGGPISASAYPGSIGNGFSDVYGNSWSVSSGNALQQIATTSNPFLNNLLARLFSSDIALNSQIVVRFTFVSTQSLQMVSRLNGLSHNTTGYVISLGTNGQITPFSCVNGALTALTPSSTATLTAGTQYDLAFTTTQTNSTTTTLSIVLSDTSATTLSSVTTTDATAALQNLYGFPAITFQGTGSQGQINRVRTYNDTNIANASTTLVVDYTPSGGPIAASPAPGSIANGFTDVYGNSWSVSSGNALQQIATSNNPFVNNVLSRINPQDYSISSQIIVRFTQVAGEIPNVMSRFSGTAGNTTAYVALVNSNGSVQVFSSVAGNLTSLGSSSASIITAGTQYDVTLTTYQANSTTTVVAATLATTGGSVLAAFVAADTTAALQGIYGYPAFSISASSTSITAPGQYNRIRTFTDIPSTSSTAYAVNIASTVTQGVWADGSITLSGGSGLTAPLVVTLSDGNGGVFSPSTLTIPSGAVILKFLYKPTVSGTRTITASHTGGNVGMTGDGTTSVTVTAATVLDMNSPSCVTSPYNWSNGVLGVTTRETLYPGAYARFYIHGTTTGNILTDPNSVGALSWAVDGGQLNFVNLPASGITPITLPDTGSHVVTVRYSTFQPFFSSPGRFSRNTFFGLRGLQLGSGGVGDTGVQSLKNMLIYSDSIGEGFLSNNSQSGNEFAFSGLTGEALRELGYEYGVVATGSLGYTSTGLGGVPPLYTPGNDSLSSWNKIDMSNARSFTPAPDLVIDTHGTNDQAVTGNTLTPTLADRITQFYTVLRSAIPRAKFVKVVPFGGYARSDIVSAVSTYVSQSGDTNITLVDFNIDSRMSSGSYTSFDTGRLHPGTWGNANIAALLLGKVIPYVLGSASGGGQSGPTPFFPGSVNF